MLTVQKVSAVEAKTRLGQLIDEAQHHPITITRNGRDTVVVVSARTYQRQQQTAVKRLQKIMDNISDKAGQSGINEIKINHLLKDES